MKLTWLAFVLALAATAFCLFGPLYRTGSGETSTLLEVNGVWGLAVVAFPTAVAAVPLVLRKRGARIAAAGVLAVFAFVSGFTVGLFYWPAGIAMIAAAVFEGRGRLLS